MRNQMFTCSGWLLGILFVISVPAFAQNESEKGLPFVTDYTPKIYNGSPTNWSAIQDNDGIVYFGQSNSGSNLLQYDGVKWERIPSRRSSIISRCQGKDKNGVIYYGGSGEFGYLDKDSIGKTQEHSLVQYLPKDKRNFGDIWSINFADKNIYFQSRERLFRLTKTSSGKDENWTVKTWEPSTHFMYSFYVDDVFYVHEQGVGLLKIANDSLTLIAGSEFLGKDRMQVMLPYNEDSVQKKPAIQKEYLLGTFTQGMYIFDGKNFRPFKTEADTIARQYMLYRGVRSNGNYILSFLGYGLVVISPQGKIMQVINKNTGLVSDVIYAIYPDNKGDLWLAQDNGISKVSVNSPFTIFNAQSGIVAAPLSLARIPDGSLYVGTNNGLLKFNPATSKFDVNNQVPRNQVFNVVTDGNTLLVPCDGLFMIKNGKTILVQPSVNNNLKGTTILISKKHPELMYVGTSFGVVLFIRDPSKITGWQFLGNIPDFKGEVFSLAEKGEGSVWGATVNGTPFRFTPAFDLQGKPDISKTKVESFGEEQGLKVTLGFVFELAHKVYFTSDSATYTFNEKQHAFEKATFSNFSNFVGLEDSTGKIWMTVGNTENYKLIIATPQPGGSYQLDSTSLLPVIDQLGSNSTVYPDKNGIVWFTNPDRLIRYDDKIKSKVDLPYKVLISDITAGNQKLNPYETLQKNSYEIKSADNSLSFQYAAPFFEQEDKTQYQTWLEGFEKTWSGFGKNTYKEYTNLSAGKYTFHVRAKNLYHTISEEAVYSFTILPPWYSTWWAYCSYLILFGLLAFGFIRRQRHRVIAKERQRSEMREANLKAEAENERRKNIELISEMGRDITASLSIEHIIDTVYAHVNKLMDASVFGIGIHNKEKHELEFPATKEKGQTLAAYSYELGDTTRPASWCFNNKKEIFINDLEKEHQAYISDIPDATEGENSESIIYLPLIYKDKSIGVITAQSFSKNAYNDYHLNILRSLATYTAVALDNADAYRNLKATQTQLVQSEKMASLGELTAGIAHEIQNPLNFVNNFSEVNEELLTEMKDELVKGKIDDAVALANDAIENQKKIIHHGKRADAIVKSMLQHSRASSGKQESTDINALCDEYLRLAYHGLRAKDKSFNAKFETDLDSTIEKINIVPQEMGRVVLNLINNAFYAVDEKKKQHGNHYEPTVLLSTKKVGDKVLIAIKDNGNGIPQKVADKIFQPFFTTKPTGEGTGLGLSLSYDIVKAHGGEIKMKTREGEGTEFVIQLPLVH